jgi:hypothetical protein
MFGTIVREQEEKGIVNSALSSYSTLLTVFEKFTKMCCDAFEVQNFNGAVKCIGAGVFSVMGFVITASFRPVSDDSGNLFGRITFKHETTELFRIMFDVSGKIVTQTCSDTPFVSLHEASGFNSVVYSMLYKFINSNIMKDKQNGN